MPPRRGQLPPGDQLTADQQAEAKAQAKRIADAKRTLHQLFIPRDRTDVDAITRLTKAVNESPWPQPLQYHFISSIGYPKSCGEKIYNGVWGPILDFAFPILDVRKGPIGWKEMNAAGGDKEVDFGATIAFPLKTDDYPPLSLLLIELKDPKNLPKPSSRKDAEGQIEGRTQHVADELRANPVLKTAAQAFRHLYILSCYGFLFKVFRYDTRDGNTSPALVTEDGSEYLNEPSPQSDWQYHALEDRGYRVLIAVFRAIYRQLDRCGIRYKGMPYLPDPGFVVGSLKEFAHVTPSSAGAPSLFPTPASVPATYVSIEPSPGHRHAVRGSSPASMFESGSSLSSLDESPMGSVASDEGSNVFGNPAQTSVGPQSQPHQPLQFLAGYGQGFEGYHSSPSNMDPSSPLARYGSSHHSPQPMFLDQRYAHPGMMPSATPPHHSSRGPHGSVPLVSYGAGPSHASSRSRQSPGDDLGPRTWTATSNSGRSYASGSGGGYAYDDRQQAMDLDGPSGDYSYDPTGLASHYASPSPRNQRR